MVLNQIWPLGGEKFIHREATWTGSLKEKLRPPEGRWWAMEEDRWVT